MSILGSGSVHVAQRYAKVCASPLEIQIFCQYSCSFVWLLDNE